MRSKNGFTLIELVVTVGIIGIVMVSLSDMMINSLRAKNRIRIMDKISQNGDWITSEIRKNLLRAPRESIDCPVGGGAVIIFGDDSSNVNTITCSEGSGIASQSAEVSHNIGNLVETGIKVTGCGEFVGCQKSLNGEVMSATIKFILSAANVSSGQENQYSKTFESEITIRR